MLFQVCRFGVIKLMQVIAIANVRDIQCLFLFYFFKSMFRAWCYIYISFFSFLFIRCGLFIFVKGLFFMNFCFLCTFFIFFCHPFLCDELYGYSFIYQLISIISNFFFPHLHSIFLINIVGALTFFTYRITQFYFTYFFHLFTLSSFTPSYPLLISSSVFVFLFVPLQLRFSWLFAYHYSPYLSSNLFCFPLSVFPPFPPDAKRNDNTGIITQTSRESFFFFTYRDKTFLPSLSIRLSYRLARVQEEKFQ